MKCLRLYSLHCIHNDGKCNDLYHRALVIVYSPKLGLFVQLVYLYKVCKCAPALALRKITLALSMH